MPAYVCLIDRWRELSVVWRAVAIVGCFLTSFVIFDLLRRPLYTQLMQASMISVGAVLVAICLLHIRSRSLA
jgi:hypothetical protein